MATNIYDFLITTISGEETSLAHLEGKALLIVNVASKCGFTPQYKQLETLYQKYKDQDLEILGFPCNQFGAQEPGDEEEIAQFCKLTYDVSFPMFSKIDVNGKDTHPLYDYLKESLPGLLGTKAVKWNFTKFFIDKNGVPIKRFAPKETPLSIIHEIEKFL